MKNSTYILIKRGLIGTLVLSAFILIYQLFDLVKISNFKKNSSLLPPQPEVLAAQTGNAGVKFYYDASGQRIAKIEENGNHSYYVSPSLEIVVKPDGTTFWRKNYSFAGKQVAVRTNALAAESIYYTHQDHLGSTVMVTKDGAVVSRQAYHPYGSTKASEGNMPTEKQYTGQVSDVDATGLYYYNARYYNPQIAKFTQPDTTADQINRYAYVGNNPVNAIDPSGHECLTPMLGSGHAADPVTSLWRFFYCPEDINQGIAEDIKQVTAAVSSNPGEVILGIGLPMAAYALAEFVSPGLGEVVDVTLCAVSGGGADCMAYAAAPGPNVSRVDDTFGEGAEAVGDAVRASVYTSQSGAERLIVDPSKDPLLAEYMAEAQQYLMANRTSRSQSRVSILNDFVYETMGKGNPSLSIEKSIYRQSGGTAYLGQFASCGTGVCRERAAALQVLLAQSGKESWMSVAKISGGRHAWVTFLDTVTNKWTVADPRWHFVMPLDQAADVWGGIQSPIQYWQFFYP